MEEWTMTINGVPAMQFVLGLIILLVSLTLISVSVCIMPFCDGFSRREKLLLSAVIFALMLGYVAGYLEHVRVTGQLIGRLGE